MSAVDCIVTCKSGNHLAIFSQQKFTQVKHYTFKDLGMKNREISNWTRRRPMPSSTGRVTPGPWGWSSTSRHIDNGSKTILSTILARWSVSCTKKNQLTLEGKRQVKVCWNICFQWYILSLFRKHLSLLQSVLSIGKYVHGDDYWISNNYKTTFRRY